MEDVEQLKREVAELKAALQGKADKDKPNIFSTRQIINNSNMPHQGVDNPYGNAGLQISNAGSNAKKPAIMFGNGENNSALYYDTDRKYKIINQITGEQYNTYNLLDSRDTMYSNYVLPIIGNKATLPNGAYLEKISGRNAFEIIRTYKLLENVYVIIFKTSILSMEKDSTFDLITFGNGGFVLNIYENSYEVSIRHLTYLGYSVNSGAIKMRTNVDVSAGDYTFCAIIVDRGNNV